MWLRNFSSFFFNTYFAVPQHLQLSSPPFQPHNDDDISFFEIRFLHVSYIHSAAVCVALYVCVCVCVCVRVL